MKITFLQAVEKAADELLGYSFEEVEAATGKRIRERIEHPKKKNGRCGICGFRIRSSMHNSGVHHQQKHR